MVVLCVALLFRADVKAHFNILVEFLLLKEAFVNGGLRNRDCMFWGKITSNDRIICAKVQIRNASCAGNIPREGKKRFLM